MTYIPAPARGVLKIQAVAPPPKANIAWWNTVTGALCYFNNAVGEWLPVGESIVPDPGGNV